MLPFRRPTRSGRTSRDSQSQSFFRKQTAVIGPSSKAKYGANARPQLCAPFLNIHALGGPCVSCSSPDLNATTVFAGLGLTSDDVERQASGVAVDKHTKQIIEGMALPTLPDVLSR